MVTDTRPTASGIKSLCLNNSTGKHTDQQYNYLHPKTASQVIHQDSARLVSGFAKTYMSMVVR